MLVNIVAEIGIDDFFVAFGDLLCQFLVDGNFTQRCAVSRPVVNGYFLKVNTVK